MINLDSWCCFVGEIICHPHPFFPLTSGLDTLYICGSLNGLCVIIVLMSSIPVDGFRMAPQLGEDIHGFHEVRSDFVDLHRA